MKPVIKMDGWEAAVFLIASIVIPPLFIINCLVLLCQIIVKKREEKELEEFNKREANLDYYYDNCKITLSQEDLDILSEKIEIIANIYVGIDSSKIKNFIASLRFDQPSLQFVQDYIDYLIELDKITPAESKTKEIQEVIAILDKYITLEVLRSFEN